MGFYLKPALELASVKHSFAAGVLVVCAMDALGSLVTGSASTSAKIKSLCRRIPDLSDDEAADIFYESFRNGLVHNARIKRGSEFSVEISTVALLHHGRLIVNPGLLAKEVARLLDDYIASLYKSVSAQRGFRNKIKRKFKFELNN
jgi:hypothetical protein